MPQSAPRTDRGTSAWRAPRIISLAASAVVALVLLAFSWPTYTSTPKDLPLGVVASEPAYAAITQEREHQELPFALHRVHSREEAAAQIERRESYGALVLPESPEQKLEVLTSPAANNSVATMISTAGTTMHNQRIAAVLDSGQVTESPALAHLTQQVLDGPTITPIVPLGPEDPQGSGLTVAAFPLVLGGIIGGVLISLKVRGTAQRLFTLLLYSPLAAALLLAILHSWFGFLPTANFALWAALSLSIGSTASLLAGLHSLLGTAGIGIGAIITMFIGNPLSGATLPPEFLPWHFGSLGRFFVPGAAQELLRTLSYFPEASTAQPWLVLTAWTALGLLCLTVKRR